MTITLDGAKDKNKIISRDEKELTMEIVIDNEIKKCFVRSISSSGKYIIELLEDQYGT